MIALLAAGCSKAPVVTSPITTYTSTTYTMADVQAANSATKCYTVISGSVYDLTGFLSQHPGGEANILKICGKDGTTAFDNQHGGQNRPETTLANYKIGTLKTR